MTSSYILIKTAPKQEYEVFKMISALEEVEDSDPLFGEFDIICKVNMGSGGPQLGTFVVEKIRSIPGVRDTKTLAGTSFEPSE